jgi:hypothetical protein
MTAGRKRPLPRTRAVYYTARLAMQGRYAEAPTPKRRWRTRRWVPRAGEVPRVDEGEE